MENALRRAGLVLCLAAGGAAAQPNPETQALRRELEALRADYEARIQALEQRLRAAESATARPPATAAAPAAAAAPEPAVNAAAPVGPPQAAAGRGLTPAISLILSGQYGRTRLDPSTYRIAGFPLPTDTEIGPGSRGFSLAESELTFSANVDPWFRGAATVALTPENEVEVEEAFVESTALGRGLTAKAGRFLSGVGYLNSQHRHVWDFADAPARMVVSSAYQDPRPSDWLGRNAGIPVVRLPFTVGASDAAKDLFGLFDDTIGRLLAAAGGK